MKKIFDDFDPISSKQWKQKIQFELQGADYNTNLIWNSPEDIQVKPFYHREEYKGAARVATKASSFKTCQNIYVHDPIKSNLRACNSIKQGAESIRFTIKDETIDIAKLLENIALDKVSIYFHLTFLSVAFVKKITAFSEKTNAIFFCNLDPIGQLAKEGNWFSTPEKTNFDSINELSKVTKTSGLISINGSLYQNAGANIVQQIAYSLAHANEYFNRIKIINQTIVFEISVGSNYFFEIAKLRALRLLFHLIAREYNHNLDCHLLVSPSKRNKTVYASHVNLMRCTTEYGSAILGGADTIVLLPYDFLYHKDNNKSAEITVNQITTIKENHIHSVNNPADGSYYIESLTTQLAEKALSLFKEIESNGGFLQLLNEGILQRKIQESAAKEQELFDSKKEILVGTNKHLNRNDLIQNELELYPFAKVKPRKTLITPLLEKRIAEKIEQERLKEEH